VLEVLLLTENAGLLEKDDQRCRSAPTEKQRTGWIETYTLMVWMSSYSLLKRRLVITVKMLEFLV
jgi:hypothetical protein